jgi:hypothetical protein
MSFGTRKKEVDILAALYASVALDSRVFLFTGRSFNRRFCGGIPRHVKDLSMCVMT